ncbi:flagellar type III secretion system pore protein FliP [Desulfosporosinus sp. BICA1-9]|uniref:flagellar type III secretion system pore protein FliP n=1 Tax=Desulfosporosinus sp. BICA1-9 TaxID=1531958 RepID=UPI00054C3747|nr:flagellar type III secretion system pore protein FliP [Desulfosporosinus sp. BICA1-9]KJS47204.1 MAG: flagellar biosynthesis protein flip [Peptococcaceae bacterium BRH_c23]KJS90018.1 MAG: flagellar biosynthesis protein flip [Desulfosporosinus sp. BICA1-9]HBW36426.1 flagellar biosynthetic protein FliP [Desulfosporosinus sp.]
MSSSSSLIKRLALGLPFGIALGFGMMTNPETVQAAGITLDLGSTTSQQTGTSVQLLLLMTLLSLAPAILMMMTSFTRIIIVLSFVRNALGTQQLPPNQVLVGLALFLTFFIMIPTWNQINTNALQPYMNNQITQTEALNNAEEPLRIFMFKQTREKDLELFVGLSKMERPKTYRDVPTYVLIPAFVISELKTAFQMGFAIFIPFIVIDMIVASTLMSIGMMMLPPMMVSLPFKILLFVLVDGWHLVVESLVTSFK